MFEYVCAHVIPGCHYKNRDEREEAVLERATAHFRTHHSLDHFDEPIDEALKKAGITFIRPA
jgi:predicted small metal-binding protein